jgi:hypothetical protein
MYQNSGEIFFRDFASNAYTCKCLLGLICQYKSHQKYYKIAAIFLINVSKQQKISISYVYHKNLYVDLFTYRFILYGEEGKKKKPV